MAAHSARAARLKLVTDSTADLPREWRDRWRIEVVPAFINIGDQSFPDDDSVMTRPEFYRKLGESQIAPRTSAPPIGLAQDILARALSEADHVIAFTVASTLSGIYNTVRLAGQAVDPNRITVYDSGSVSMGLGWQVVAAAEALERGADLEGALAAARDTRRRVKIWLTVDDLQYLRRSGRINHLMASLGTLLDIKPIITLHEGHADVAQRVRTLKKAEQTILTLARQCAPLERLAVMHTAYPDGAQAMFSALADIAPNRENGTILSDVNTAMGTHYGPIALGVVLVHQ